MGKTKDLHNQIQALPDITTQDIEHVRTILGVNSHGGKPSAGKHVVSPRRRRERAGTPEPRRKMFARRLAANAFRTTRWGGP
jgi:hypothetical protein